MVATALAVGGSLIAANASRRASDKQTSSADKATKLQHQQYKQTRQDSLPWLEAGKRSLADLEAELGSSFETSKGYDFLVSEGEEGVLSNLSALGMSNSGAALKRLTEFREGLAQQEYGNWFSRKEALAQGGRSQSTALGALGANYANNTGQSIQNAGAAAASGYVGGANALNSGLNQVGGYLGYRAMQQPQQNYLMPHSTAYGASISPQSYNAIQSGVGGLY